MEGDMMIKERKYFLHDEYYFNHTMKRLLDKRAINFPTEYGCYFYAS